MSDQDAVRLYMEHRERDLEARITKLETALAPFAALYHRPWLEKRKAISCAASGGYVGELQAISLGDVLNARDALGLLDDEDVS